jgi:hypothetical protein
LNLGHLYFDIVSDFVLRISDFASLGISTLVENPLQISPFLTNKPNFRKSQMNVNNVLTKDYEKMYSWSSGKNKANSNPIQTQYKANTNPIQSQNKANQTQFQGQKTLPDAIKRLRRQVSIDKAGIFL